MKIVYVLTRSDVIGGASVHLLDLAYGAQQAGHTVVILVGGEGAFQERAYQKGLRCISLRYMVREISPLTDMRGFFELRKAIEHLNPDIVHMHSSKAGILGRLVCMSLSIPAVFTAHGWAFTEGVSAMRRALYKIIERFMARFTDKIITVSNYDKELALKLGVGSEALVSTIHNGMPDSVVNKFFDKHEDALRLIMVARFDAQKDHQTLLKALASIKKLRWFLELVGDGPLLEMTKETVRELGLTEHVFFSGACNDVPERLAKADVFILISNWEGLPLTILEAMRSSLPVIATKVGGVPETVEHGKTGFLIERNDQHALAASVARLIESDSLRVEMGRQGRRKFEETFTFETMLSKTLRIYSEVLYGK